MKTPEQDGGKAWILTSSSGGGGGGVLIGGRNGSKSTSNGEMERDTTKTNHYQPGEMT